MPPWPPLVARAPSTTLSPHNIANGQQRLCSRSPQQDGSIPIIGDVVYEVKHAARNLEVTSEVRSAFGVEVRLFWVCEAAQSLFCPQGDAAAEGVRRDPCLARADSKGEFLAWRGASERLHPYNDQPGQSALLGAVSTGGSPRRVFHETPALP